MELDNIGTIIADKANPKKKFHMPKQLCVALGLLLLSVILEIIAWNSTTFCDWYNANIYPVWVNTFGRITSLLPFSFGEILIMLAVFGIPLSLISMVILLIIKKGRRNKIGKVYSYIYLWIVTFVVVTEVFNCFILYHCSSFGELYGIPENEHTTEQLEDLAEILITKGNALATQVRRNDEGEFVLTADLDETAISAMQALGEKYPQLDGYYVTPKKIICSYFMSQQYLMGIYFPFSMEANYNRLMYESNLPVTVCHELAHTRGFIQEDEANFISFLACDGSDNVDYQYSGYLNTIKYVLSAVSSNCSQEQIDKVYDMLCNEIRIDINGNSAYWREIQENKDTLISSETVAKVSDKAMDTSLKLNGVEDGKKSYGRVVDLLLGYYFDM